MAVEIILVSKADRGRRTTHIGRWGSRLAMLTLVAAVVTSGFLGYRLAHVPPDARPDLYAAAWTDEVQRQRRQVTHIIRSATESVDALALQLGELQARVVRLDALGIRLMDMAKLDPDEFNFTESPARGGPVSAALSEPYSVLDFVAELERLVQHLDDRAPKLLAIESALMSSKLEAEVSPSGRPIATGWLSSGFGWRTDPMTGKRSLHDGLDFAGKRNADIVAVASGVVVWSGYRNGYGKVVEIYHGNGYATRYAHNAENRVRVGATVKKGQNIALLGSTGDATGPHVHFEVLHHGKAVDPLKFIGAE